MNMISRAVLLISLIFVSGCKETESFQLTSMSLSSNKYLQDGDTASFSITGGVTPYTYSILSGPGSINSATGVYTASGTGAVVVQVSDSSGLSSQASLEVLTAISLSPGSGTLAAFVNPTFAATGGGGQYTFEIISPLSALIDALTGVLTRPWASGSLAVKVTDQYGLSKTANLTLADGIIQQGGAGNDYASFVGTDADGNVYTVVRTAQSLSGFTNAGLLDLAVIKYNKYGQELWHYQFGTAASDSVNETILSPAGEIYLAFDQAAPWTSGALSGQAGCNYIKFNANGSLGWVKSVSAVTSNRCRYTAMAVGEAGYIYVSGQASGTVEGVPAAGVQDNFLYKLDASTGATVWFRFIGIVTNYYAHVYYDSDQEKIVFSGVTDGTLPGKTNIGGRDLYVTVYDKDGNRLWADQWGDPSGWSHYWSRPFTKGNYVVHCGTTGQTWPNTDYVPVLLIHNKTTGARVLTKVYSELRVAASTTTSSPSCYDMDDGILFSFRSKLAVTGFTASGGSVYDSYYAKYDSSGTLSWSQQLLNFPALVRYNSSTSQYYGITSSATDFTGGSWPWRDTYLFSFSNPGDTPVFSRVGFTGTAATQSGYLNPTSGGYFLYLYADGSVGNATNGGGYDTFLMKLDTTFTRQ